MERLWAEIAPLGEPALRLALVILASGLIGWERELRGHAAGLRTNMMVALGAAVFTMLSEAVAGRAGSDPTRVISGVAQGIGFLGAGMIFREESKVKGLTTAATIWVMGGLGIAWGIGAYRLGTLSTIAVLVVLRTMKRIEPIIRSNGKD